MVCKGQKVTVMAVSFEEKSENIGNGRSTV